MRAILVDWMNEGVNVLLFKLSITLGSVTEEFRLKMETLCLAVNYVDRYLSRVPVPRHQLQLVGVASLLIASYAFPIDSTLPFSSLQENGGDHAPTN